MIFSRGKPKSINKSKQAKAAAPAPETTNLQCFISLLTTFKPFKIAAPTMIAVPC